jgi:prepilin-type N-terminal cleavage/methylation domain-containing protein
VRKIIIGFFAGIGSISSAIVVSQKREVISLPLGGKEASMHTPSPVHRRAGFTLIELLTVIAIIAILTAIIFPVFATVEENARQQSSMSNLHQIQTGLAQFKLDEGTYPPVLFGYAVPGASMSNALTTAEQNNTASTYFTGLYPEYIKDPLVFTDGDNEVTSMATVTSKLQTNEAQPVGTSGNQYDLIAAMYSSTSAPNVFYEADAYDVGPEIGGTNKYTPTNGSPTYVVRYQTNWTGISPTDATDYASANGAKTAWDNYTRQLRWQNPPADTYVTCTTDHVLNDNKVLVLWLNGSAQSIDASTFLAGAAGNCNGTDSPSAYGANFWQVSPTDHGNLGYANGTTCGQ